MKPSFAFYEQKKIIGCAQYYSIMIIDKAEMFLLHNVGFEEMEHYQVRQNITS